MQFMRFTSVWLGRLNPRCCQIPSNDAEPWGACSPNRGTLIERHECYNELAVPSNRRAAATDGRVDVHDCIDIDVLDHDACFEKTRMRPNRFLMPS